MLHGWSGTADQFRHQLGALALRNRCIALDMRDHGDSEKVDLRMWRKNLEEKARTIFREEAFDTSDETIDLSKID